MLQAGGNMEGKETRFGIADSGLFATITTLASCGAVIAMHDAWGRARYDPLMATLKEKGLTPR